MKPRSESAYYARPEISAPLFEQVSREGICAGETLKAGVSSYAPPATPTGIQAHARSTDPETSHKAAASVVNLGPTRDAILKILGNYGGLTDEELWGVYERKSQHGLAPYASPSGVRSRRSELVKLGFVVDSGTKSKTQSGRESIVWRAK